MLDEWKVLIYDNLLSPLCYLYNNVGGRFDGNGGDTLMATSHTRLRTHDHYNFKQLSLVEKVELVQVHFTLHLRDQQSKWMQDGYKVYMDSYMTSNGSCFMVIWIIFKNHLLKVGLTQNRETMTL